MNNGSIIRFLLNNRVFDNAVNSESTVFETSVIGVINAMFKYKEDVSV